MADFARRVHNRLAAQDDLGQAYIDAHTTLMAAIDRCEQDFRSGVTTTARRAAYSSILTIIARELGIAPELAS